MNGRANVDRNVVPVDNAEATREGSASRENQSAGSDQAEAASTGGVAFRTALTRSMVDLILGTDGAYQEPTP